MNNYLYILREILRNPKHFQSDFARENAYEIAEAASRGHISCLLSGVNVKRWTLTKQGSAFLYDNTAVEVTVC